MMTDDQRIMMSELLRDELVRIDAEIGKLQAKRRDAEDWLADHGTSVEKCRDCFRPVDVHANHCPQFRWPAEGGPR